MNQRDDAGRGRHPITESIEAGQRADDATIARERAIKAIRGDIRRALPPRVAKELNPFVPTLAAEAVLDDFDRLAGLLGYTKPVTLEPEALDELLKSMGYSRPRLVETIEELEALPDEAVVRDSYETVFEILQPVAWASCPWTGEGKDCGYPLTEITLPATVLWVPKEAE
ncbi:hypothetical protein [Prescottella equi]|uniref:hypothetical protein n=1 Tax=Rhodococcus hoagii TaxID=43767 RepID=UPI001EE9EDD8|nr:hypothetical protein [Prescottella equi]